MSESDDILEGVEELLDQVEAESAEAEKEEAPAKKKAAKKAAKKAPAKKTPPKAEAKVKKVVKYKIIIHEAKDEPQDQFVSSNGRSYQIKRGEEVVVPAEVVEVLKNAKAARLVQTGEGQHQMREYMRIPFQILETVEE